MFNQTSFLPVLLANRNIKFCVLVPMKWLQASQMENSIPQCILSCVFEISFRIHQASNSCLCLPNAIVNPLLSAFPPEDRNPEPSSFPSSDHDLERCEISSRTCRKCNFLSLACISKIVGFIYYHSSLP